MKRKRNDDGFLGWLRKRLVPDRQPEDEIHGSQSWFGL